VEPWTWVGVVSLALFPFAVAAVHLRRDQRLQAWAFLVLGSWFVAAVGRSVAMRTWPHVDPRLVSVAVLAVTLPAPTVLAARSILRGEVAPVLRAVPSTVTETQSSRRLLMAITSLVSVALVASAIGARAVEPLVLGICSLPLTAAASVSWVRRRREPDGGRPDCGRPDCAPSSIRARRRTR
jgi:hypothetical protein